MTSRRAHVVRVAMLLAVTSCIIAEPGTDPPKPPVTRPHIVRPSVVPAAGPVLGQWPAKFDVPVELSDPTLPFGYVMFIDYDSSTDNGITVACGVNSFEAATLTNGGLRLLEIALPPPPDLDRCHVVEVLVALQIVCNQDSNAAHSPPEPGGDSVTWTYNPTGGVDGCPTLDAGLEASRADASGQPP
jgi:hypothetical protein